MKQLRKAFTQNAQYSESQLLLIDLIICFLTFIKKKGCKTHDTLQNLICNFIVMHTPLPDKKNAQFIVFDKNLGGGVYGDVYDSGMFEMVPIITKCPKVFETDSVQEIFLNIVVINSMLMKYPWLRHHLVPTFGIFICGHTYEEIKKGKAKGKGKGKGKGAKKADAENSVKKLVSVCDTDEKPNIHLVQQKIKGKTLYDFLESKKVSLLWVKKCLLHLLKALIVLEKSEYNVYHRDLHGSNIMIDDETEMPFILDFGISSFQLKTVEASFCFYDEIRYDGKRVKSAANDVNKLMRTFYYFTKNTNIKKLCKDITRKIFGNLWKAENETVFGPNDDYTFFDAEVYSVLHFHEDMIARSHERAHVHAHNMAILNLITYSSFKDLVV